MDRLLREGNPPVGQLASPKPQYKDVQTNDWEELKGEGGASYVKDKDALAKLEQARLLLASIDGKDFATDAKLGDLQTLLDSLDGKDFATQTTLAQVKTELDLIKTELETIKANQLSGEQKVQLSGASGNIISPATEDKLEQVRQLLSGVATEAKLEQARTLLDAISTKDFATQTTLAAVLTELANVKSDLEAIKANQTSGDQKVQLSGKIVEVITIINAESIPAGGSLKDIDMSLTGREEEIWILVNIDKQPWSLLTNAGNTTSTTMSPSISPIYPRRSQHTTVYTSVNAPSTHLFYGLRLNMTGIEENEPSTLEEAKKLIIPIPVGRLTLVNHSAEIATATVRILRRFKS